MNPYLLFKSVHVACVVVSGSGFLLRGAWMLAGSPLLQRRVVRTVPHVVDTLLLASALAMVVTSGQYPFALPWMTAKLAGLGAYVACGTVALRRGRTFGLRVLFLGLSIAAFAYIVSVAVTRNPAGFLVFMGVP